jgi:DNA polymerase-3 subunit alpha
MFTEPCQLHNHSKYSLLDAIPDPEDWLGWCLETGTPGFAVTDHGTSMSMFHARRFPKYIEAYNKKHGTKYALDAVVGIPAVELYVKIRSDSESHNHITVWAVSNQGFKNLMKLSSLAWGDVVTYFGSPKPRVTFDQILKHREGLKFGTGCIVGPIGSAVMDGDLAEAERLYLQYQSWFGDDLYIEFHPTNITHDFDNKTGQFQQIPECVCGGNKQLAYNRFLKDMIEKHGGKAIPVTDAHFIAPDDKILQDCVLKKGNSNGWYFYESYHAKTADQIYAELSKQLGAEWLTPERFQSWINNSYEVMNAAKSIDLEFPFILPEVEIPPHIRVAHTDYDHMTRALLIEECRNGGRWRDESEYVARFEREMGVICDNGTLSFAPYFLLYADVCSYAWSIGEVVGPGRGSAGGCLISFYLGIVQLDPVAEDLPFERFLSLERIKNKKFPDIDVDFSDREPILKYLSEKYGSGFAQICTYQTMKIKNAIYDASSHLLGKMRNDPELTQLTFSLPDSPQGLDSRKFVYGYTDKDGNYHPGLVETHPPLATFFKKYPQVEAMVKRLLGFISAVGRHASAYVVSTRDIESGLAPTMIVGGEKATQFEASMVEAQGLVKADFLSVTTLASIRDAIHLIKQRGGPDYLDRDGRGIPLIYRLPEDAKVYDTFYSLDVDSVFQFNTDLIKGLLKKFNPRRREDLAALTALGRPGALDAPFVNEEIKLEDRVTAVDYYISVRNGKRKLSLLHPDLAACTHNGIFVYQEDIKKFFEYVGFPAGVAEQVMQGVAKKKLAEIQEGFKKAREALPSLGWSPEQIETVLAQITAFAEYSFNRSHSRAYSEVGYVTAYLKHYHPLEWWTGVLNANVDKEEKLRHFMSNLGESVKGPTLAAPSSKFTIAGNRIVAPLTVLKKVGDKAVDEMVSKGPFVSLQDFVSRVDAKKVNAGVFKSLVKGRAVDDLMDQTLPYSEARLALLHSYAKLKKNKKLLDEEILDTSPLGVYMQEREVNTVFNRPLASLFSGSFDSIADAETHKGEAVMVLQLVEKERRSGVSKAGNDYTMQKCAWSDGIQTVESVRFKETEFVNLKTNTICKVTGKVSRGFANRLQVSIEYLTPMGD